MSLLLLGPAFSLAVSSSLETMPQSPTLLSKVKLFELVLSSTKSEFNSCGFKKQRKIITNALVNSCFEVGPKNMEPMMFLSKYFVP